MTNRQILLIGAVVIAVTALVLGCPLEDVVRALAVMVGLGV